MARRSLAEIATGAGVLLLAAGFLAYAAADVGGSAAPGYTLHATFDHVDGLSVGSDVRIAGVKVGTIQRIALDPKTYLANVSFSVRKSVSLTDDSSAQVATDGLLGGKFLQLASGGDAKMLPPGGTIVSTQGSVNLESLLGKYIFGSTGAKSAPASQPGPASPSTGVAPLK